MSTSARRARWPAILIAIAFGVVALVTAALLSIDSPPVRAYVRQQLVERLGTLLAADVAIGRVSRLGLGRISLRDVAIGQHGQRVLTAKELVLDVSVEGILPPRIALRGEVVGPELDLARDPDGQWNVVRLFVWDTETPSDESESPLPDFVANMDYRLTGGTVRVVEISAFLTGLEAKGAVTNPTFEPPRLLVDDLRVKLGDDSQLGAQLSLALTGPGALTGRLDVAPLVARDLGDLAAPLRPEAEMHGHVDVTGTLASPSIAVELESGAAALRARAEVSADARVSASARIDAFDPAAVLVDAPPGMLTAEAEAAFTPSPTDAFPRDLVASLSVFESTVAGVDVERLAVHAERVDDTVQLRLEGATRGSGVLARFDGTIGASPPHAVTAEGEIRLEDPSGLPADVREMLADTQLVAEVRADVTDARAASTGHLDVTLAPGQIRGLDLRNAELRMAFDETAARVERIALGAGRGDLTGSGEIGLGRAREVESLRATVAGSLDLAILTEIKGLLNLDLAVEGSITNLGGRLHATSDGALPLSGVPTSLDARVEVRGVGSSHASGNADLTARLEPQGAAERMLGGNQIPLRTTASWTRSTGSEGHATDRLAIEGTAGSDDTAEQRWAATVESSGDRTVIDLTQLMVRPPRGRAWQLVAPARAVVDPAAVAIDQLRFGSGDAGLTASGRIARTAPHTSDLRLGVEKLELEPLCVFGLSWAGCSGRLDANVLVAGTPAHPDLRADVHVAELKMGGQRYGEASLALRTPRADRLTAEGGVSGANSGSLRLSAGLPLTPGEALPAISWTAPAEIDLRLADFAVDALRALTGPAISRLDGEARGELLLRGSLDTPRLSGSLAADDLVIGVDEAGGVHRDGRLRVSLAQDRVTLDELTFDQGAISGSGAVDLGGAGRVDLAVSLRSAKVVDRPDVSAHVTGDLALSGRLEEPSLTGELVVDPAIIRPSLSGGKFARDPSIQVVSSTEVGQEWISGMPPEMAGALAPPAATTDTEEPAVPPPGFYDLLSIMMKVQLGDSVAINRFDAHLRLTGELDVSKAPRDTIRISGEIAGRNGWYIFQGRRLEIERARATFNGGVEIDPYLDVEADYRAPDYLVIGRVTGTATKPTLDLSSEPPLDEADILAVLLFGKPTSQLSGAQGQVLQQQALALLASYVAPELQRSVLDSVGLTSLTFSMPTGDTAGTLGVGRYFGEDIFVSLAQDFGGPKGGTQRQLQGLVGTSVTLQYFVTPSITLQGASSTEGESSVDAIWQRRY